MRTKIIIIMLLLILSIIFIFQFKETRRLKKVLKQKQELISTIQKRNELNIIDLQTRNEELNIRNQELRVLYETTENISNKANKNDCINQPINNDIVKLLQKSGI